MRPVCSYIGILFTLMLAGYNCSNSSSTEKKASGRVLFYHRNRLGLNEDAEYDDYLAISNYRNNTMTARDFYNIAKKYADTVKANLEVNSINIMGKDINGPRLHWDSEIWGEEKKYCVISFSFKRNRPSQAKLPIELTNITIWKNSIPLMYNLGRQKKLMDSVLNSPIPLNNE